MMKWYMKNVNEIIEELNTSSTGLNKDVRAKRLEQEGANELTSKKKESEILKFIRHFNDLLIYVLIGAGILKIIQRSNIEAATILLVVVINALIGYVQERKATNSLNSLRSMMSTDATILSNNEKEIVPAASLVRGDIVILGPGKIVPADLRIIESYNLVVEEAILTGESAPIAKNSDTIGNEADLGDCINMAFSGTLINSGTGKGVVVATGDHTELGSISTNLKNVEKNETPLIKKMKTLNHQIFFILTVVVGILLLFSIFFRELAFDELIASLIALAVSAVPEGLPAVLSIILSMGVTYMAKEHAIIKQMPAVETLGSMSVICSDKTGTLTKNEMAVVSVITKSRVLDVEEFAFDEEHSSVFEKDSALHKLAEIARYCNNTKVNYYDGKREVIGNPTEGALLDFANHLNLNEEIHVVSEIPFDSSYKYMAVLISLHQEKYIYLKGAPDIILNMVAYEDNGLAFKEIEIDYWLKQNENHAKQGRRILAGAYKKVDNNKDHITHKDLENEMILAGLYGIIDPPKKSAIESVAICREAGISVKMITGDHKDTAIAIAKEIGLEHYNNALVGSQIEQMNDEELQAVVMQNDVFARTTPEHKLRLVTAIQANDHIVGMTGDGVNDAPALKKSDIGIAMGIKGTQVTKDTSDMILSDDNFSTIAKAVKEGRRVYDNLKKTIYFALPTAFAQGLIVLVSLVANIPLPLTTMQILWLNMVTTITLSFALGFEPAEKDIMHRKPRNIDENILNGYAIFRVVYVSLMLAGLGFIVENFVSGQGASANVIQTTLLQTLVIGQGFYMINCRSIYKFSLTPSILKNKFIWISLGILCVIQAAVIYIPVMNDIMGTTPIGLAYFGIAFGAGIIVFVVVEIEKKISSNMRIK